jgi:surface antigen
MHHTKSLEICTSTRVIFMRFLILIVSASLMLSACETTNEDRGAMLGALAGGILGNQIGGGSGQTIATGVGMAIGASAGQAIGVRMDEVDLMQMQQAQAHSLEFGLIGESTGWTNPESSNSGSISPVLTYQNSSGQYCREFQQEITVGGQTEQGFGTACREPNGSWRIIGK